MILHVFFLLCIARVSAQVTPPQPVLLPPMKCEAPGFTADNPLTPDDNVACDTQMKVMIEVGRALNRETYARGMTPLQTQSSYQDNAKIDRATNTMMEIPKLGMCDGDCDVDSHCAPGLLCADKYKTKLRSMGYDSRKANCGPNAGGPWNYEVCFDPILLTTPANRTRLLRGGAVEETEGHVDDSDALEVVPSRNQKRRSLNAENCVCDSKCRRPTIGTRCAYTWCGFCQRRRRRKLQTLQDIVYLELIATNMLRSMVNRTDITAGSTTCSDFLQNAICTFDEYE